MSEMINLEEFTTDELFDALEGHQKLIQLYTRELDAINGYKVESIYSDFLFNLRDIAVSDYEAIKQELLLRKETLTDAQLHVTSGLKNK